MPRPQPILLGTIALGAAAALLTGCSPAGAPGASSSPSSAVASSPANTSELCAAADAHAAALENFKSTLKPDATLEQVHTAQAQVAKTYDDLVKARANLAQERADAVKSAEAKFNAAVDAVPSDATLTQAADSLRDEASNVEAAVRDLRAEVKC